MNIKEITQKVENLVNNFSEDDFIYDFMLAYGLPKATITRVKTGARLSKKPEQLIVKNRLFFETNKKQNLHVLIDDLDKDLQTYSHKPRFIIVTDYKTFLAIDTKTKESLDVEMLELPNHASFFLPWAGQEKHITQQENPADVKAASKMAKIYDEITKGNPELTEKYNHELNIFLTRLLFCFFAEDTDIFEKDIFTKAIAELSKENGSDLNSFFEELFETLNTGNRASVPAYLNKFPYVNGNLFASRTIIPKFSIKSRKLILECGKLNWKEINPDIFGSMFQAVKSDEARSGLGQHYTSVPNIMKVINPLFLDDLIKVFNKYFDNVYQLNKLLSRISQIKIFDPACGSGNFLIIAYKKLRELEIAIIQRLKELETQIKIETQSGIQLVNFYGIEIDDFACEVAKLSLWLAEHQMNLQFKEKFGYSLPTLPLKENGKIVFGNATRMDWARICYPIDLKTKEEYEVYILGNPPYLGARKQSALHKEDMQIVFQKFKKYKNLDYIACWFHKASIYINNLSRAKFAFVSTSSIIQGQQVSLLKDKVLFNNLEIFFAYQPFKWQNNAKNNAMVTCVIIGISQKKNDPKILFDNENKSYVKFINLYLKANIETIVQQTNKPISKFPKMCFGNMPNDGGGLILTTSEKEELIKIHPEALKFVKFLLGADEFINGKQRWCLWIQNKNLDEAVKIPFISGRIERTRKHRLNSIDKGTIKLAERSHQFRDLNETDTVSIIIPKVSSERRKYIPVGFIDKSTIITDLCSAIYNAEIWLFGMISSRIHMVWVNAVAGRFGTGYRYTPELCYNTFPFPEITETQKQKIEMAINIIIMEREKHSEKTMAELYDPNKMPKGLRKAHADLDLVIEQCYRVKLFENDEKRLEYLFTMYEAMTQPDKKN